MAFSLDSELNQFPSLTWHHLHINHGTVSGSVETALSLPQDISIPEGISFERLASGVRYGDPEPVPTQLGDAMDLRLDEALSFAGGTVGRYTVAGGVSAKNVRINVNVSLQQGMHEICDTEIVAREESSSCFIFDFTSASPEAEGLFAHRIRVYAAPRSQVHVVTVNRFGPCVQYVAGFGSRVQDGAEVCVTQLELGGSKVFTGCRHELPGHKASSVTRAAWFASGTREVDCNYIARHEGKSSVSEGLFNGVVRDDAKKTWRGTIDFKKGCTDSAGDEQENVLLLSPAVTNKSMPVILCDEEAIEGRHGSSCGRLSADMLLYLQSRGIDEKTASALLVAGRINAVARFVPDEELRAGIREFLEESL